MAGENCCLHGCRMECRWWAPWLQRWPQQGSEHLVPDSVPEVGAQWVQGAGATAFSSTDVLPRAALVPAQRWQPWEPAEVWYDGARWRQGVPACRWEDFPVASDLLRPCALAHWCRRKIQRIITTCLADTGVRVRSHQEHKLTPFFQLFLSSPTTAGCWVTGQQWPAAPTGLSTLCHPAPAAHMCWEWDCALAHLPACAEGCVSPCPHSGEYGPCSSYSQVVLRMRKFIAKIGNLALPQGKRKGNYCFIPRAVFVEAALSKGWVMQPSTHSVAVKSCVWLKVKRCVGIFFALIISMLMVPCKGLGAPLCRWCDISYTSALSLTQETAPAFQGFNL